jgi:hypothetical protein
MDVRPRPGHGPSLGGRDSSWTPAGTRDAREALDDAWAFCSRRCPIFHACAEEACHVYRIEQRAQEAFGQGPASEVGVLDKPTIGVV